MLRWPKSVGGGIGHGFCSREQFHAAPRDQPPCLWYAQTDRDPRPRSTAASPSGTGSRTSGQEDAAHDHDPHNADDGRDEPRIGAVR